MEIPNTSRTIATKYGMMIIGNVNVKVVSINGVEKNIECLSWEEKGIILKLYENS